MPNNRDFNEMSKICEAIVIQLFEKNKNLGEVDMKKIISAFSE